MSNLVTKIKQLLHKENSPKSTGTNQPKQQEIEEVAISPMHVYTCCVGMTTYTKKDFLDIVALAKQNPKNFTLPTTCNCYTKEELDYLVTTIKTALEELSDHAIS